MRSGEFRGAVAVAVAVGEVRDGICYVYMHACEREVEGMNKSKKGRGTEREKDGKKNGKKKGRSGRRHKQGTLIYSLGCMQIGPPLLSIDSFH